MASTKRNVLIGCLGAGAAVVVAALVVFYVLVLRPVQSVADDLQLMSDMYAMNSAVPGDSSFVPPPDGLLTPDDLARFARVQTTLRDSLGESYRLLDAKAAKLDSAGTFFSQADSPARMKKALAVFDGLGPTLVRAKGIQVRALARERFSVPEYRWLRSNFYQAMGKSRPDLYLEDFVHGLMNRQGTAFAEAHKPPLSDAPANRDVAAAYTDSLDSWFPFYVFGL